MDPITWAIIAGLNVALAASKASQQEKQRKMEAEIRAAEIEASPWTGKAATTQMTTPSTNVWGELAGAGVNTLGQGAALQKAGLFSAQDVSEQVPSPETAMPQSFQESPEQLAGAGYPNAPFTLYGRNPYYSKSIWSGMTK